MTLSLTVGRRSRIVRSKRWAVCGIENVLADSDLAKGRISQRITRAVCVKTPSVFLQPPILLSSVLNSLRSEKGSFNLDVAVVLFIQVDPLIQRVLERLKSIVELWNITKNEVSNIVVNIVASGVVSQRPIASIYLKQKTKSDIKQLSLLL